MTINDVVWRQACSIKQKSDALVAEIQHTHTSMAQELSNKVAILICCVSAAYGDISPMCIYDDIISQVSELQTAVWSILKTCDDSTIQSLAQKVYDSCVNMKRRLRQRMRALCETVESLLQDTPLSPLNAPEAAFANTCAAACT